MRAWVNNQHLDNIFLYWDQDYLVVGNPTVQYHSIPLDTSSPLTSLRNNAVRHLVMFWKYIKHLVLDSQILITSSEHYNPLDSHNFLRITYCEYMNCKVNDTTRAAPSPPSSLSQRSGPRATSSTIPTKSLQHMNFKKVFNVISLLILCSKMNDTLKPSNTLSWSHLKHMTVKNSSIRLPPKF